MPWCRKVIPTGKFQKGKKKDAACNLPVTSLKSACHSFIVIQNWDGLVCRFVSPSPLSVTCPSISHTAYRESSTLAWHLLSFLLCLILSSIFQLYFSSNLPFSQCHLPCSPIHCWISCGLHRFPASPSPLSSSLELEAIPEYSMMAVHLFPLCFCLCMSLSVPIVLLLTLPCPTPPHSSFLSPSFMFLL